MATPGHRGGGQRTPGQRGSPHLIQETGRYIGLGRDRLTHSPSLFDQRRTFTLITLHAKRTSKDEPSLLSLCMHRERAKTNLHSHLFACKENE